MSARRWLSALAALWLGVLAPLAQAAIATLPRMERLATDARSLPPPALVGTEVPMPDIDHVAATGGSGPVRWYRGHFDLPPDAPLQQSWAVYLPYLYQGGQVWLNGVLVGDVRENDGQVRVMWEGPHLLGLSGGVLHPGANELALRVAAGPVRPVLRAPQPQVGPTRELMPRYDQRLFWTQTVPQVSAVVCMLVAALVLFIWWRRPGELLYGLFGIAAALWGVRTLTFVLRQMPAAWWHLWRVAYLGATSGFIVVLAIFSLRLAGIRRVGLERGLLAFGVVGPLWLLLAGQGAEELVNRVWSAALIPIGLGILGLGICTVVRQRTWASAVLPAALGLAVLAGVHDYMLAWGEGALVRALPQWAHQRIFLLHHSANLVLLAMGGLLTARFIHAVSALQDLNQTLEARVADRERALAANFERMAALRQEHAAAGERQRIMRELHDGLGSRLFTSLSRVERGDMDAPQIAEALRGCIADMRLAIDALMPEDHDLRTALGNFLFRWQSVLEDAGVRPAWTIDVPDGAPPMKPQDVLQLLRIAQEALTNVLKHARATQVRVYVRQQGGALWLAIEDDGRAAPAAASEGASGRGLRNMQERARQLGGRLAVDFTPHGARVRLELPLPPAGAGPAIP
ncbi:MAG: 7TM diverse intracellular signaling domain-containing protein [Acidovorax sp.]